MDFVMSGKFSEPLQKMLLDKQIDRAKKILASQDKPVGKLDIKQASKILSENLGTIEAQCQKLVEGKDLKEEVVEEDDTGKKAKKATTKPVKKPKLQFRDKIITLLSPEQNSKWKKFVEKTTKTKKWPFKKRDKMTKAKAKKLFEKLRTAYQYDLFAYNLNQIDSIIVTLKSLEKESNWWKTPEKAPHQVEIIEALWAWGKAERKRTKVNIPNLPACDVRTGFWQKVVNVTIDNLKEKHEKKAKKQKPFVLPNKIVTKALADLSNIGTEKGLEKLARDFKIALKHFAIKARRLFTKGRGERSLLLLYRIKNKKYIMSFTSISKVTLKKESKNEIREEKIQWKAIK
jgi:hypothetical protein